MSEPRKHPSADELAQYAARTLPVSALLNVDDHLATCADCRAALARPTAGRLSLDDHLSYEQLEAMADGREPVDEHARECAMCAAELRDLRALADGRRWSKMPWWMPAGAAVAAGVALFTFVMTRPAKVEAPVARTAPSASPFDAEVQAALASGTIAGAPGTPDWRRDREQLLGDTAAAAAGSVISPVAETVESDRPVFRWNAVQGARGYRVEVYDSKFNEVARSAEVAGTEWRPEMPLPRGATYTWVVAAGDKRFPQPPAPEAKFAVLGAEGAAEVERARASGPLALGVVAARLGLWPVARTALDEAARGGDERVVRLRKSLDGK